MFLGFDVQKPVLQKYLCLNALCGILNFLLPSFEFCMFTRTPFFVIEGMQFSVFKFEFELNNGKI